MTKKYYVLKLTEVERIWFVLKTLKFWVILDLTRLKTSGLLIELRELFTTKFFFYLAERELFSLLDVLFITVYTTKLEIYAKCSSQISFNSNRYKGQTRFALIWPHIISLLLILTLFTLFWSSSMLLSITYVIRESCKSY